MLDRFEFKGKLVRFIDGKPVANDVADILGYADPSSTISKKVKTKYKGVAAVATPSGVQSVTVLEEDGIKQLLASSRKSLEIKEKVANFLNIELNGILRTHPETELITTIQLAFNHCPSVTQFFVSGYRIDLYFPSHRIAVECDENGHNDYHYKKERKRQDTITQLLGCKFIRFNPNSPEFNIGNVINKIMVAIYE
jgi:very-short-patch-repair endonuclease